MNEKKMKERKRKSTDKMRAPGSTLESDSLRKQGESISPTVTEETPAHDIQTWKKVSASRVPCRMKPNPQNLSAIQ